MKDSIDLWIDVLIEMKFLSAQLAQGDITKEEFRQKIPLNYITILEDILKK